MKQLIIFISFLLGVVCSGYSQANSRQKVAFGWRAGISAYAGDLSPARSEVTKTMHPSVGIIGQYLLNSRLSLRGNFNYSKVSGNDALSNNIHDQRRNLSFETNIWDASAVFEFNFMRYELYNDKYSFTPYIFGGIGLYGFNPKAELDGEKYELQPLGTEGQNFSEQTGVNPYSLMQLSIPIGGGVKYNFGTNITLGLEVTTNRLFTDYLDDVSGKYPDRDLIEAGNNGIIASRLSDRSDEIMGEQFSQPNQQRGDASKNDNYFQAGVTVTYTLTKSVCPYPKGGRSF